MKIFGRIAAALIALAALTAAPAMAQRPNGSTTLYNPACNGGAGGLVGNVQTSGSQTGFVCPIPNGSYITSMNTPTISTSAYTSGFVLGGIQSFNIAPSGLITNAEVVFNSGTFSGSVNLILFNASPTGGGTTDHAALALTSTDTAKIIGVLQLTNCTTLNSGTVVQCALSQAAAQAFNLPTGSTVYAVAQVIGTPTFTGTGDAIFTIQAIQ